ncbi:MAG: hypothetical protein M1825_004834 [Sarcosagium campestre]|nr:MAG: hypothetical protein M1825_004834 [Sarcosagium campestre]
MLTEQFLTSTRSSSAKNTTLQAAKDIGIHVYEIQPYISLKNSFKKSSTDPQCLVASSTHVYAAQTDKAVVHVYSREQGKQETIVPFPERIHSLTFAGDVGGTGVLVLGTEGGRIILWEVCTGRQVSTHRSHLQSVITVKADSISGYLLSGSLDSTIHVWSLPALLSFVGEADSDPSAPHTRPLRVLNAHRGAITAIELAHGVGPTNFAVSASRDNTCIVWDYHTGEALRTFLLPSSPLSLAIDPCDRAFYAGFEDGSVQIIEFYNSHHLASHPTIHQLHDSSLQAVPVQPASSTRWQPPDPEVGAVLALTTNYEGTFLYSGHSGGALSAWDLATRKFSREIVNLSVPLTNVLALPPTGFATQSSSPPLLTAHTVIKPRYDSSFASTGATTSSSTSPSGIVPASYALTAHFTAPLPTPPSEFELALTHPSFPPFLLAQSLAEISAPPAPVSSAASDAEPAAAADKSLLTSENAALKSTQKEMLQKMTEMRTEIDLWKKADRERRRREKTKRKGKGKAVVQQQETYSGYDGRGGCSSSEGVSDVNEESSEEESLIDDDVDDDDDDDDDESDEAGNMILST